VSAPDTPKPDAALQSAGTGSVAHSIIGQFVGELAKQDGFAEIAKSLVSIIYDAPSEASLRAALFGDETV
jgi:hypothetical protein